MPSPTALMKQTTVNTNTNPPGNIKPEDSEEVQAVDNKCMTITSGVTSMSHKRFDRLPANVSLHTIIGGRKSQEDRFCIAPRLFNDIDNVSFFGVFDGTVGDFASENIKDIVVPTLKKIPAFQKLHQSNDVLSTDSKSTLLRQTMKSLYAKSDEELLRRCGKAEKHYATCTSVTMIMWQDLICVGHVGDSRICLIFAPTEKCRELTNHCKKAPFVTRASSNVKENTVELKDTVEIGPRDNISFMGAKHQTSMESDEEDMKFSAEYVPKFGGLAVTGETDSTHAPTEMEPDSGGDSDSSLNSTNINNIDPKWVAPGAFRTETMPVERVNELIEGNFVTRDHKPDQQDERARIEKSGGSVEYLQNHQNKPFIRGGDFQQRKILGESPMQLQYSRAFGGKDLKPFGLTADPSINITKREKQFVGFILASDGLWDVVGADTAARVATKAWLNKQNPSDALVNAAVDASGDNITVLTVMYDTAGGDR